MKVTRRELAGLVVAGLAADVGAEAAPEDDSSEIDKFELKQDVEPAFSFKA